MKGPDKLECHVHFFSETPEELAADAKAGITAEGGAEPQPQPKLAEAEDSDNALVRYPK